MKLNGAAILIECLIEQGAGTVFGFPGGAVLPIYDELYKRQDRISHILTAHEQHAGHAADGYARATGRTGVCIATSGPGATNLVTAIATAYMDSTPVVFITGNVPQSLMGTDSFQEADISGITMPITKHNYMVTRVERLADGVLTISTESPAWTQQVQFLRPQIREKVRKTLTGLTVDDVLVVGPQAHGPGMRKRLYVQHNMRPPRER